MCLEEREHEMDSEPKTIAARIDDFDEAVRQFLFGVIACLGADGRTAYLAKDIQASPANVRADVIRALRQCQLSQYISKSYNARSLRAFVREVADELCCSATGRTDCSPNRKSARSFRRRCARPSRFRSFIPSKTD